MEGAERDPIARVIAPTGGAEPEMMVVKAPPRRAAQHRAKVAVPLDHRIGAATPRFAQAPGQERALEHGVEELAVVEQTGRARAAGERAPCWETSRAARARSSGAASRARRATRIPSRHGAAGEPTRPASSEGGAVLQNRAPLYSPRCFGAGTPRLAGFPAGAYSDCLIGRRGTPRMVSTPLCPSWYASGHRGASSEPRRIPAQPTRTRAARERGPRRGRKPTRSTPA